MKYELLPFAMGSTAGVTGSTDKQELEGREFVIEDMDYSANPVVPRSYSTGGANEFKTVRIVRNTSGVALGPALLVRFDTTKYGMQVNGYARVAPEECYPTDEFLPSGGVANNDLFYIVVSGKAKVTCTATAANAQIPVGTIIVNDTAAASTASTTAGKVTFQDTSGATTALANMLNFGIGVMLTACTTAQTNALVLAHIWRRL